MGSQSRLWTNYFTPKPARLSPRDMMLRPHQQMPGSAGNGRASRARKGVHMTLQDSFGRRFRYLRLSVTDVCNFRCNYCLPDGYQCTTEEQPLSVNEIQQLAQAFA